MGESVKRSYRSELRAEQARRTRWQVVTAAGRLFARDGFRATTIDAVAAEAGVSRKTVFSAVGGKVALLKLAYDWALAGDDEPLAMYERPELQAIINDPDSYHALAAYGTLVTGMSSRVGALYVALQAAAEVDDEASELYRGWESQRRQAMRDGPVARFLTEGLLREDVTPGEAADILALLVAPSLYHQFVTKQGWPVDRFRRWLTATMLEQVLRPRVVTGDG